ncbi:MAG TPA: hypothetical protein P5233_11195 [Candidatus Paceibacterota bacterium]|nr:hypothetical protein [Candidatus Paceibacterota bacterium]
MGKKTRLRDCPAAGRLIEAAECALGRHTTYACPEGCRFNVFAPASYEALKTIELSADKKFFGWLLDHVPSRAEFEAGLDRLLDEGPISAAYFRYLSWHGVYRKDAQGRSVLDRWAEADFQGLSSDERIIMRGWQKMRPAMLEAHRIMDDRRVETVDLLDPERKPILVVDRSFAAQAVRFGVYFATVIPLPHYARLLGTCIAIPHFHPLEMEEVIFGLVSHLGGGREPEAVRQWLAEHADLFEEGLTAVALARRQRMFELLDAQAGKAVYQLAAPYEACCQKLTTVAEIDNDELRPNEAREGFREARVWFVGPQDEEMSLTGAQTVLGRILLGQTHWRLEAMGADRLARLRTRFEALLEAAVKFVGERRDDLAAQVRLREPKYDPALVPPALLRDVPQLKTSLSRILLKEGQTPEEAASAGLRQKENDVLDKPIPALDNHTPRAAANMPELRNKLIRWLKFWIFKTDTRNLETGQNVDTNWMLRELGVNEILFEPPPRRRRLPSHATDEPEDEVEAAARRLALSQPPALPDRAWNAEEAAKLMAKAMATFPSFGGLAAYLQRLDYPLLADLADLFKGTLEAPAMAILFQLASWVLLCFAPEGTRPAPVEAELLLDRLKGHLEMLSASANAQPPGGYEAWVQKSRQPALLQLVLGLLIELGAQQPQKQQVPASQRALLLAAVAAVVDAMDIAARRQP